MKINMIAGVLLVLGIVSAGCATMDTGVLPPAAERAKISRVYVPDFKGASPETARIVRNSVIGALSGTVGIADSREKADAVVEGVISLEQEGHSSGFSSGGSSAYDGGRPGANRHFINGADLFLKSKGAAVLYSVSLGQTVDTIYWSGEFSPAWVGDYLGNKLTEYFK